MRLIALLFPVRVVLVAIALFIAWQVYVFSRPRPRDYNLPEVRALNVACRKATDQLKMQMKTPARVGVVHLVGDANDMATTILRDAIATIPEVTVQQGSPIQKFWGDIEQAVSKATSLDEVLHAGRRVEIDMIVAGRVLAVESSNDTARASIQLYAFDVRPGKFIMRQTIDGDWRPNPVQRLSWRIMSANPRIKFILWLAVTLVLPWATMFATRWALEKKSNLAGFIVVGGYTLVDMLLAVTLAGFSVVGGLPWLKMLAALLFSAGYTFWACEKIGKREI